MAWVIREHIEIASDSGRLEPRITGHRIRVQDVVIWYEKLGMSTDEIVHNYPTITLADVYATLAYYWDNRDDIEQAIADEKSLADEFRRNHAGPLRRKLMPSTRG
jgi:uncharacterized protein (DUF433 family)